MATQAVSSPTATAIGAAIRHLRCLKQMNQSQLAEHVGLSQASISAIEKGKALEIDNLDKIAHALGLESTFALFHVAEKMAHGGVPEFELLMRTGPRRVPRPLQQEEASSPSQEAAELALGVVPVIAEASSPRMAPARGRRHSG